MTATVAGVSPVGDGDHDGGRPRAAAVVRRFLDHVRGEGDGGLAALDARILRTHNPIERMDLVERRRRVAEERRLLEDEFVRCVAGWAAAVGVGRAAFEAEGVPPNVLDRAGFEA